MSIKKEFKYQLELIEEPIYEIISEAIEKPSFRSTQIVELFGMDFLRTAKEKLTDSELDTIQDFIDIFVNLVDD